MKLLLNPVADGAFFEQTRAVARASLELLYPGVQIEDEVRGSLRLLHVDLPAGTPGIARLPFVQACLGEHPGGGLDVLDGEPGFDHPSSLVTAARYRGKTHEVVTQLAIELALSQIDGPAHRLLDPMAGRGTTLLWGCRYGLEAVGVEQDPRAPEHLHRHLKRQAKLHRIKHKYSQGWVGPKRADGVGRFVDYRLRPGAIRLTTGDTRALGSLLGPKPFDILVVDLPYGVEFRGSRAGLLALLGEAAEAWAVAVRAGGAMVVVFNRLFTRPDALAAPFVDAGLERVDFEAPHRMSESIERDLMVLCRRP